MFNKSFNLTTALKDLTLNVRKSMLFAMVGTCNTALFNFADRLAKAIIEDGYDPAELEARDIQQLAGHMDDVDSLTNAKRMAALTFEWRDMLHKAAARDDVGLMSGTIEMMCGKQRMRVTAADAAAKLSTVQIVRTPEQRRATLERKLAEDQRRADERSKYKGFIERIIDTVFTTLDWEDAEWYTQLDEHTKEVLCTKFFTTLDKLELQAIENVELGASFPDALGLTDIVFIQETRARLMSEVFPIPAITKAQQADGPGPKAKRVKRVNKSFQQVDDVATS